MYLGNLQWLDFGSAPGILDWLAFLIGGTGIAITVWQLLRSRSALESARKALVSTRSTLMKNQLAAVLPKYRGLLDRINDAIINGNRETLRIFLDQYVLESFEAHQLIISQNNCDPEVADQILRGAEEATAMRALLFDSPETVLHELVQSHLDTLRSISLQVYTLEIEIRNDPREEVDEITPIERSRHARH